MTWGRIDWRVNTEFRKRPRRVYPGNFYRVTDIADALGISRATVTRHIKTGLLKAGRVGNMYVVSEANFRAYVTKGQENAG